MSDGNDTAYVYALHPINTLNYFYVGSTKFTPAQRLKQHLDNVQRKLATAYMINKVRKIGAENVVVSVLEICTTDNRWDREYHWIGKLIDDGYRLVNTLLVKPEYIATVQFPLKPHHFEEILNAYESGLPRNGYGLHDSLAEVVEVYSKHLIDNHPEDLINQFDEMVLDNAHDEEVNKQTDALRERIFAVLERNRSSD
jgi:hypothetical protein